MKIIIKKQMVYTLYAGTILLVNTSIVDAALVSRLGGQAVFDSNSGVTWLADSNLAISNQFGLTLSSGINDDASNTVGSTGRMTWTNANAWIAGMNSANYLGYNDWRLPTVTQPDAGCSIQDTDVGSRGANCTLSEMGNLFYNELSGVAINSVLNSGDPDLGLFQIFETGSSLHWTGSEASISAFGGQRAWNFDFSQGLQNAVGQVQNLSAWAVRTGDVSSVPVPAAAWLFGSGLLVIAGVAKRKKA